MESNRAEVKGPWAFKMTLDPGDIVGVLPWSLESLEVVTAV